MSCFIMAHLFLLANLRRNITQGMALHFLLTKVRQQPQNDDNTFQLKVIKFLWVLSQDTNVQRKLCNDRAVEAFVEGLKQSRNLLSNNQDGHLFYIVHAIANLIESSRGNPMEQEQIKGSPNLLNWQFFSRLPCLTSTNRDRWTS